MLMGGRIRERDERKNLPGGGAGKVKSQLFGSDCKGHV